MTNSLLGLQIEIAERLGYEIWTSRQPVQDAQPLSDSTRSTKISRMELESDSSSDGIMGLSSSPSSSVLPKWTNPHIPLSQVDEPSAHEAFSSEVSRHVASPVGGHYRKQEGNESPQQKILQAITDVDEPTAGSTIIFATGYGGTGQFNEEEYLRCIRTALKIGWHVELHAWSGTWSKLWQGEFSEDLYKDQIRIVELENFAVDLLDR